MKNSIIFGLVFTFLLFQIDVYAQQQQRRGNNRRTTAPRQTAARVTDTTKVNTPPPAKADTIPVEEIRPKFPWEDTVIYPKRRLRAINFNTQNGINAGRTPQPFERLREDDAIQSFILWREIDTREKMNTPFRATWKDDNGRSQNFYSIVIKGIMDDSLVAFEDENFTKILDKKEVKNKFILGSRVEAKTDENGNTTKKVKISKIVQIDSVFKYRIMEEWVFDKRTSRLHARILALGLMIRDDNDYETLCWIYYPEDPNTGDRGLRGYLSSFPVYNAKNNSDQFYWDQFLDMRLFSSRIYKSKLDNAYGSQISEYINSPLTNLTEKEKYASILRILEGDRIQSTIFNYEQDVWSH